MVDRRPRPLDADGGHRDAGVAHPPNGGPGGNRRGQMRGGGQFVGGIQRLGEGRDGGGIVQAIGQNGP